MNEPTKRKRRHFSHDQRAALVRRHRGDKLPVSDLAGFVQRGLEKFPRVTPRIISDNGPQFTAREFNGCHDRHRSERSRYTPNAEYGFVSWDRAPPAWIGFEL